MSRIQIIYPSHINLEFTHIQSILIFTKVYFKKFKQIWNNLSQKSVPFLNTVKAVKIYTNTVQIYQEWNYWTNKAKRQQQIEWIIQKILTKKSKTKKSIMQKDSISLISYNSNQ